MAYIVRIFPRAERDLASLYEKIGAEHVDAALRWYQGLRESILSLEEHPNRCSVTPENGELRHLLYGHNPTSIA